MIRCAEVRALPVRNVVGLMTGTSMDGLDVALCRITASPELSFDLVAFETVALPAGLKDALAAERLGDVASIARAHVELGRFFADALAGVLERHPFELHLIGSHGQTVWHEHRVTTLQLGEPSPMAERFGCPVVHDFRAGDIAAGGSGAPLVPYIDYRLLGGRGEALLAVNIGGISNFTALPPKPDTLECLIAMDCGPGNMVLDRLALRFSAGAMSADLDGQMAARGRVLPELFEELIAHPFFSQPPPKSTGREQFGPEFVDALLASARPEGEQAWCDLMATAAELTAFCIDDSYRRHVAPTLPVGAVAVSGGGARHPQIMKRLAARVAPIPVRRTDDHGLPAKAKEAIAFAILASERIDERPANVPSVTGASRFVLLGKITEC